MGDHWRDPARPPSLSSPARLAVIGSEAPPLEDLDLSSLFQTYSAYVARISIRLLGRDHEIDDAIQDVFLEAIRGIGQLREPAAIKGWLSTVSVRVACRRLRVRKLRAMVGLDDATGEPELSLSPDQESRVLVGEVYAVLNRLPVNDRVAWILRHVEGCSLEEVGSYCGCALATTKRRIASAQRAIEEAFKP